MKALDWFLKVVQHENDRLQQSECHGSEFDEIYRDFERAHENFEYELGHLEEEQP